MTVFNRKGSDTDKIIVDHFLHPTPRNFSKLINFLRCKIVQLVHCVHSLFLPRQYVHSITERIVSITVPQGDSCSFALSCVVHLCMTQDLIFQRKRWGTIDIIINLLRHELINFFHFIPEIYLQCRGSGVAVKVITMEGADMNRKVPIKNKALLGSKRLTQLLEQGVRVNISNRNCLWSSRKHLSRL